MSLFSRKYTPYMNHTLTQFSIFLALKSKSYKLYFEHLINQLRQFQGKYFGFMITLNYYISSHYYVHIT